MTSDTAGLGAELNSPSLPPFPSSSFFLLHLSPSPLPSAQRATRTLEPLAKQRQAPLIQALCCAHTAWTHFRTLPHLTRQALAQRSRPPPCPVLARSHLPSSLLLALFHPCEAAALALLTLPPPTLLPLPSPRRPHAHENVHAEPRHFAIRPQLFF